MELFSLLAKLTLDSSEYDKKIQSAEQSAKAIKIDEPVLTLDDSDFTDKIHSAQSESVDDMTGEDAPDLGLDSKEFSDGIKDANEAGETFASGMTEELFVSRYTNPRDLKNHLNDLYRLNINEISDHTLLRL